MNTYLLTFRNSYSISIVAKLLVRMSLLYGEDFGDALLDATGVNGGLRCR